MNRNDVIRVLRDKPNSSLAESIRNLRTSILFSNVDTPPKVIMFSSSVPREGKSTTSMLVALTSRQMGKSAIIVDCDLRMPSLAKVLQVDDETPGLLSILNESASVEDAVYREPETGLHVLMTRPAERTAKINAADVLASDKFSDLISDLKKTYDLVVIDTPPTLVVTDARIVSELADAVVFAVRWDKTPRAAVQEGLRELTSVNAKISGVVLTLVNEQRASKYSYDGYSYYKGRYRDYYEV
jgi:capsular exopolysaccharide synthesis family protein